LFVVAGRPGGSKMVWLRHDVRLFVREHPWKSFLAAVPAILVFGIAVQVATAALNGWPGPTWVDVLALLIGTLFGGFVFFVGSHYRRKRLLRTQITSASS
jgi:RsiW-degrading membrane proteinase PrsW (M82 family)